MNLSPRRSLEWRSGARAGEGGGFLVCGNVMCRLFLELCERRVKVQDCWVISK